jgi:hypothetical protein
MKMSYMRGIFVKSDAIANSIRDEITWLISESGMMAERSLALHQRPVERHGVRPR